MKGYYDYDVFQFVAPATSSGAMTATLRVPSATTGGTQDLAALPIYKNNGATPVGAADVTVGLQYELTFADVLDSGNGGFVLR